MADKDRREPESMVPAQAEGLGTQRATPYGYSLGEFEVYREVMNVPVASLALNKSVVASSSYTGYPAANATDGDVGSRWSSAFSDSQWIYVDLGIPGTASDYYPTMGVKPSPLGENFS